MEKIVKFIRDEDGLELSEYAVMGFLIIAAITGAVTALRTQIGVVFNGIATTLGG